MLARGLRERPRPDQREASLSRVGVCDLLFWEGLESILAELQRLCKDGVLPFLTSAKETNFVRWALDLLTISSDG